MKCSTLHYANNRVGKICPYCNKHFKAKWNYHIEKCKNKVIKLPIVPKSLKICIECFNPFKTYRSSQKTCSNKCNYEYRRKQQVHRTSDEKENLREIALKRYEDEWKPKAGRCKKIKYESRLSGIVSLDGTWEFKVAQYLDSIGVIWIRNTDRFSYSNLSDKQSYYTPDFYVYDWNSYLEIKGYETDLDRTKWIQFKNPLIVWKKEDLTKLNIL